MVSYAKFDKLARELDGESTNPTDGTWTKRRPDDFYLDPAVRDREAKTLSAAAPLGSVVELEGLVKQPFYNGRKGLVVSGRLCKGERLAVELTEDKYDNRVLLVKTTQVTHCLLESKPSRIELLKPRAAEVAGNIWIGDACAADVVAGGSHIPEQLKWPPFAALVLCASEFDGYGSNPVSFCVESNFKRPTPSTRHSRYSLVDSTQAVPVEVCGDDLHRAMTAASAAASRGILRKLAEASDAGPVLVCGVLTAVWKSTSELDSSYGDIASMAWGARNLISTQVDRRDTRPVVAAVGALVLRGWTLKDAWAAILKARPGAKIGPKRWRALVQAFGDEVEGLQAAACEIGPAAFAAPAPSPAKRETEPGSTAPPDAPADPSRPLTINVPLRQ
jgi:hypothetical protein